MIATPSGVQEETRVVRVAGDSASRSERREQPPEEARLLTFGRRDSEVGTTFTGGGTASTTPVRHVVIVMSGFDSGRPNGPVPKDEVMTVDIIRQGFIKMGMPAENIVIPESDYPRFSDNCEPETPLDTSQGYIRGGLQWARQRISNLGRKAYNLYRNVRKYLGYTDPNSSTTEEAYRRIREQLKIKPGEKIKLSIVGFSGGGQKALALAARFGKDKDITKVQNVVTIGSPIMTNPTDPSVRVVSYVSPTDKILMGPSLLPFVRSTPPNMDDNDHVRYTIGGHWDYVKQPFTLRRIFNDVVSGHEELLKRPQTLIDTAKPAQSRGPSPDGEESLWGDNVFARGFAPTLQIA